MKKSVIILIVIAGVLLLWGVSAYNGLINQDENVKKAWGDVQTQYQRRADLIINLMETVKGAAANEKDILTSVTNARAGITEARKKMGQAASPAELDAEMQKVQNAALSFKITVEAYPTIQSTAAFLKFQDEIAGTENRIATVRSDYNAVVAGYNKKVRRFPSNIFASVFGFGVKDEFKARAGSDEAPEIKF